MRAVPLRRRGSLRRVTATGEALRLQGSAWRGLLCLLHATEAADCAGLGKAGLRCVERDMLTQTRQRHTTEHHSTQASPPGRSLQERPEHPRAPVPGGAAAAPAARGPGAACARRRGAPGCLPAFQHSGPVLLQPPAANASLPVCRQAVATPQAATLARARRHINLISRELMLGRGGPGGYNNYGEKLYAESKEELNVRRMKVN